jgi:hypothetical protein
MPGRSTVNTSTTSISVSGAERNVSEEISQQQIEEQIPFGWKADDDLYNFALRQYRINASGVGFISPPYTAYWDLVWGATPIEDLPKYKDLITFTPYIAACIRVKANMAISNGFELEGGTENVRRWLRDWCDEHNFLQSLRIIAWDMMVYGNAFTEICKDDATPPEMWWLKALDPVHMRIRRDQYGNVFGFIQLLTFPPVPFTAQQVMHIKNEPKSSWYEYSYGTSELRPLLLIQSYIDCFQKDMATIMAIYTKPMLVIKCGSPERPYSDAQRLLVQEAFAKRGPATDITVRGDVDVTALQSLTGTISVDWWIRYLERQRKAILGVPEIFLGEPSGTNRATADIVMQEYITRLRMLQEIIGDDVETMLFSALIQAKFGDGVELPKIKWRPIWEPTIQEKVKYFCELVDRKVATPEEVRVAVGLPEQIPLSKNPQSGVASAGSALQSED